ncbi:MAG: antitoxin family protein [Planctomycetes bacterium]|nr:antitoxin family protein [Planctomycetota bacterium]
MAIVVEATYQDGVLKPNEPLPLKEREKVRITVEPETNWSPRTKGIIPCSDADLIEEVALDKALEYEQ